MFHLIFNELIEPHQNEVVYHLTHVMEYNISIKIWIAFQ